MRITEKLISNVIRTEFESLNKDDIERAKLRFIDVVGCIIGGANAQGCNIILDLVKKWGGNHESTILSCGFKVPAHNAAMVNSLMSRSYDFEPVEADGNKGSSAAHISGTTVPTALAVAEQLGSDGKAIITSLILGDDLAARLAAASEMDFSLGWDNTGTINMLGATAVACKLSKLNERQTLDALGIALNQLAGSFAGVVEKTTAFKLPIALAARNAIFSMELAKQGFNGVNEPLLGKYGYFAVYCRSYDPDNLTKDLGKKFYADRVIKPYCCCRGTHSAIESALKITHCNDINLENVEEILIHTTPEAQSGFLGQPFKTGINPQINAAFNIRYGVANALLRKVVKLEYYTEQYILDPRISFLISKMKLIASIAPDSKWTTEIHVKTTDGEIFSSHTDMPRGDVFKSPLTKEEIYTKYRDNVAFSKDFSKKNAEKALSAMERLEGLNNVKELTNLFIRE